MLKDERLKIILDEIKTYNKVQSSELSEKLNVSEDTIRRDLKELAEQGYIKKVHGGAMATSFIPANLKKSLGFVDENFIKIIKKALQLMENNQVIIMDSGHINLKMVSMISGELQATIYTNSLPIATKLCDLPNIDTIFLGGKIMCKRQISSGLELTQSLANIHADLFFLDAGCLHDEIGITHTHREEAAIKRAFANSANQVVALTPSDQIGVFSPFKVIPIEQINTLITDLEPNHKKLSSFIKRDIEVI